MKKLIAVFMMFAINANMALAQDSVGDLANKNDAEKRVEKSQDREHRREEWLKKMPPERRAHMEERRKKFDALSEEKKKELRAEMKRHREAVEKITGEKMPMPPHDEHHLGEE